jgi:leucyl aminopeptidase
MCVGQQDHRDAETYVFLCSRNIDAAESPQYRSQNEIEKPFKSNHRTVKSIQIQTHCPGHHIDGTLILTEPASFEGLLRWLNEGEYAVWKRCVQRGMHQAVFLRVDTIVLIQQMPAVGVDSDALESARCTANTVLGTLRAYRISGIELGSTTASLPVMAFAEGLALGSYSFRKYITRQAEENCLLRSVGITHGVVPEQEIQELDALVQAVFLTRDLVNEPQSHFTAIDLANAAVDLAQAAGLRVEVLGKEEIEALGMGGLLAINRASNVPPRFCILEWRPEAPCNERPIVLIGKGVVYDSGGLSLKTPEGLENMKCDMAGAGAVMGALSAAARNNLPVHVVGLLPATDNLIGDRALVPGDIVTMYSGHTVEVVNTDAEGRIILADALHYAARYAPELVLDVATLTGAAVRALGTQAICYMGTAPRVFKEALETSGMATYERCVELPLWKEYGDDLKSNVADLKNMGSGAAGMITAGKFLEYFAKFPWLHLDIAGPAYLRTANAYRPKDGTGVGVRLLYDFLKRRAQL